MEIGGLQSKGIMKTSKAGYPLITILTVVYNGSKVIERSIQSVINQTYDNIQYIIIDGASSDSTVEILKKFDSNIDFWQSEPDNGIYNAMNKGVEFARGDFLLILGADDLLFSSDVISIIVNNMTDWNTCYYGDAYNNYTRLLCDYKYSLNKMLIGNMCQQTIFYPKKFYSNHKFTEDYKLFADWEYNFYLWKEIKLQYLPVTIVNYSGTGASSNSHDVIFEDNKNLMIKEILGKKTYIKYRISTIFKLFTRFIYMLERIKNRKKYKSLY